MIVLHPLISKVFHQKISAKKVFFLLSILIAVTMLKISQDYGITWDEWEHTQNGTHTLRYLMGASPSFDFLRLDIAKLFCDPIYLVTGLFFGLSQGSVSNFAREGLTLGSNLSGYYAVAHFLMALVGFLGILFTGLLAKEIGGWRTGIWALVLMALSPRFLGSCMNNPKDIPFATMYVFTFYFMLRWIRALPSPPLKLSLGLALGFAASIWTRAGGFILILYLYFFSFAYGLYRQWKEKISPGWNRIALYTFLVSLLGYAGGSVLWPYAHLNPLIHPLKALFTFTNFNIWNNTLLFEGSYIKASDLPWYYLPKWILISSPLFFISGCCLFPLFLRRIFRTHPPLILSMILWGALFPLAAIIVRRSIVYDSWRHVFFIYPLLIIIISLAFQTFWEIASGWKIRLLITFFLLVQMAEPAIWIFKNHPHEYVYFNSLVGGLKGALTQYQTDYWGNSLRSGAEWLANYHLQNAPEKPLTVRADGNIMSSYPFLYKNFRENYTPFNYPKNFLKESPSFFITHAPLYIPEIAFRQNWDYALVLPHKWPVKEISTQWPPAGTLHEIKADGVPLCAVVQNLSKS